MALPFADQVAATTTNLLESFAEDNVYGSSPLFYHLRETGQIMKDGGAAIQIPITYQKIGAAGSYQRYDILDTNPTDTETAAKADWKLYYAHVIISKHELLLNSGDNAKVRLIETKTRNAHLKMADQISTDLFSTNGDSSTGVTGLRNAGSTSTTQHNIATADFSGWVAQVDSSTSTISLSALEASYINATVGSDMPDIIVTNASVYKKYWALLTANQRYGEEQTASGGFKYLLFNGVPIFFDSHSPGSGTGSATNWMFMINSKHFFLYVHEDDNMNVEKLPSPISQNITVQRLTHTCQAMITNRRLLSVMSVLKP